MSLSAFDLIVLTCKSLLGNPLRSGLTTLGVFMGVAAVSATLQVGNISRAVIEKQLAEREAPQVNIYADELKLDDLEFLRQRLTGLKAISAAQWMYPSQTVFRDRLVEPFIYAVTLDHFLTSGKQKIAGRFFTPADFDNYRPVVVIDLFLAEKLFQGEDAIGQRIYAEGRPYIVVGVVPIEAGAIVQPKIQSTIVPIQLQKNQAAINRENIVQTTINKQSPQTVIQSPNPSSESPIPTPKTTLQTPVATASQQDPNITISKEVSEQEKEPAQINLQGKLPSSNIQTNLITEHKLYHHLPVGVNPQTESEVSKQAAQLFPTNTKQNRQESPASKRRLELRLPDVVVLALQNNRDIKNAYLERIAQRQDLEVAESKFKPTFTPAVGVSVDRAESGGIVRSTGNVGVSASVELRLPSGGDISFGWQASAPNSSSNLLNVSGVNSVGQNLQLRFNQPLLRGAGLNVNRASVEIARLAEKGNILALRTTLIDTVTSAILVYRQLLQAQEQLKIEELSLQSAKEFLEINQVLIEAGRVAPVDLVQNQTSIANQQVSLLSARNNLETFQLNLLKILDIDPKIDIVAVENLAAKPLNLDLDKLREIALQNRADYLQAQLRLDRTKFEQLIAENNKRWNLDFVASYGNEIDSTNQVSAGLAFTRTFGDRTLEQAVVRSRVNLQQAENNLREFRETLNLELIDEVKNVNLSFEQVKLAQQARELAEKKLNIEKEKLRLGRSQIFQVLSFQDDLVAAKNTELNAIIDYLNALTRLDKTVGTTLETWQVTIETK